MVLTGATYHAYYHTPRSTRVNQKLAKGIIHTTYHNISISVILKPQSRISPPPPTKKTKVDTTLTSVENPQRQSPYQIVVIKETNIK
jgi:hypothetical protein